LLADFHPKGEVARKYGVWLEEKGFSGRAIFIVDKNGKIAYVKIHEILEQPENEVLLDALKEISN
jgi:peroxiredoxin